MALRIKEDEAESMGGRSVASWKDSESDSFLVSRDGLPR